MADLTIETRADGDVALIQLAGEFDLAGVEKFETELKQLEAGSPAVVVVDLNGLNFMDSSGLRALVMADQRARKAERRLAIVPGPPGVKRVFEITQLDERLDLVESASAI